MGKKKKSITPPEIHLSLPPHPQFFDGTTPIVDTHTHLLSTYAKYRTLYPLSKYEDIFSFVRGLYSSSSARHAIEAIVDVWCEAPVMNEWREIADSALTEAGRKENWGGIEYWFVMGVHPHDAKHYDDDVEHDILNAMEHPRCVGWGEIGLDYHYDNSPREVQKRTFERQLRHAVRLAKPVTIHTREAEEDTESIMKAELPKNHPIHVHCFTDSPEFASRLLDHFPKLFIGITGVATYPTNRNTSAAVRSMIASGNPSPRILLETDAPYMTPSNIYRDLRDLPVGAKLPLCHTGMIPWTAECIAGVINEGVLQNRDSSMQTEKWDVHHVMRASRENTRTVYGI